MVETAAPRSWRRVREPGRICVVIGVFAVSRAVFITGGLNFRPIPPGQIHLLDLHELRADPFLAFTNLHIQPPLFNFFVGSVMRWSPFPPGISFQVLYLVAGLATVLCLRSLLRNLGAKPWVATTATILVILDPLLIRDESALTHPGEHHHRHIRERTVPRTSRSIAHRHSGGVGAPGRRPSHPEAAPASR